MKSPSLGNLVAFVVLILIIAGAFFLGRQSPAGTSQTFAFVQDAPPALYLNVILLVAIALLAILAFWLILFGYVEKIQTLYYHTTKDLAKFVSSVTVSKVMQRPFGVEPPSSFEKDTTPQPKIVIEGPLSITVGTENKYKAKIGTGNDFKDATDATWTIEPPNAAAIDPKTGAEVTVVAAVAGAFTLTATVVDATAGTIAGSKSVAATVEQKKSVELSIFGGGYGALAIGIALVVVVMVLGLSKVLTAEGITAILGALAGYIFGFAANTNAKSQETQTPSTPSGGSQAPEQ